MISSTPLSGAQISRTKLIETAKQVDQNPQPYPDIFHSANESFLTRLNQYSGATIGEIQANAARVEAEQGAKARKDSIGVGVGMFTAIGTCLTELYRVGVHHNLSHCGLVMGIAMASGVTGIVCMLHEGAHFRKAFDAKCMSEEAANWGAYLDKTKQPAVATVPAANAQPAAIA